MRAGVISVDGRWVGKVDVYLLEEDQQEQEYEPRSHDYTPVSFGTDGGDRSSTTGTVPRSMDGGGRDIPISGSLKDQRAKYAKELENPKLREKAKRIMANEQGSNPRGTQAIIESAMNRAAVRGTSLEKQLRFTSEGGYYDDRRHRGGSRNYNNEAMESGITGALAGSNISRHATDNASGGFAEREARRGDFVPTEKINGETFFRPGSKEKNLVPKWQQWHDAVGKTPETVRPASTSPPMPPASTSPSSTGGGGRLTGPVDRRVDTRIPEIVGAAATHLPPGYTVGMTSGYRPNTHNHGTGHAADFHIVDPQGHTLSNRGEDPTGMYQQLARHAHGEQMARHPELNGRFAWGGAFGTQGGGGGPRDLMHFDINGERGRYASHQLRNMGPMPGVKYGQPPAADNKTSGITIRPNQADPATEPM